MSFVCNFDHKHGLFWLSDFLIVALKKVISHCDYLSLMFEFHSDRVHVKNNISHKVGPLVAPVSDNTLFAEFKLYHLFESVLAIWNFLFDLNNPLQTRFCGHELENGVHNECTPHLALESRCFESS